jgi:hypothetical protein
MATLCLPGLPYGVNRAYASRQAGVVQRRATCTDGAAPAGRIDWVPQQPKEQARG